MSSDRAPLSERVAEWLATSGYPLEMQVAALIESHGFATYQSEYYVDLESGDLREIDVVGTLGHATEHGRLRLTIAVECKMSRDKPWVVFTSAGYSSDEDSVTDRAASKAGADFLSRIAARADVQELSVFQHPERAGYSVVRALTDANNDVPYKAMMSAAKASRSMAWEASGVSKRAVIAEVVLPLVVIDGAMFECYLDGQGNRCLTETERQIVYWRNPVAGRIHSVVTVATVRALPDLLRGVAESFTALRDKCASELEAAVDAARPTAPSPRDQNAP